MGVHFCVYRLRFVFVTTLFCIHKQRLIWLLIFLKLLINDSIFCALLCNILCLLNLMLLIIIHAFSVPIFILFFLKIPL